MRVSVRFLNYKSGKTWVKSYRTRVSATRAVKGILSRNKNAVYDKRGGFSSTSDAIQFESSKGMKYGRVLKNYNLGLH